MSVGFKGCLTPKGINATSFQDWNKGVLGCELAIANFEMGAFPSSMSIIELIDYIKE